MREDKVARDLREERSMEDNDQSVGVIISDGEARPLLFVKIGLSGCDRKVVGKRR